MTNAPVPAYSAQPLVGAVAFVAAFRRPQRPPSFGQTGQVHVAMELVLLAAVVGFATAIARRISLSEPLFLVVVGAGISFIPGVPTIHLTPDLVLFGLLPPLLYAAAIRISVSEFRANRDPILVLAFGLVIVTTVSVGFIAWWVIPGVSLAAAFALGGVVAPPDAVAATAVARRVGMPRRLVSILESESLVNDASSLVAINTALAALAGSVTPLEIGWNFVLAAGGGVLIGLVVGWVLASIRKRVADPTLDTTLSFAAPYVGFLPAEAIGASGVLAVVVVGIMLGHRAPATQSATARIAEGINWRTVQFLLENTVFLLIGLQLRDVIIAVYELHPNWWLVIIGVALVFVTAVLVRFGYVMLSVLAFKTFWPKRAWTWTDGTIVGWAGMRGVVTLSAVFLIPAGTHGRPNLVLAAFVVVAGTLILQGLTLPAVVRRLGPRPDDPVEDARQAAELAAATGAAGLARLEELIDDEADETLVADLRRRALLRSEQISEEISRLDTDEVPRSTMFRQIRLQMLSAEREALLQARDDGRYEDEVLREALRNLDMEEAMLQNRSATSVGARRKHAAG